MEMRVITKKEEEEDWLEPILSLSSEEYINLLCLIDDIQYLSYWSEMKNWRR